MTTLPPQTSNPANTILAEVYWAVGIRLTPIPTIVMLGLNTNHQQLLKDAKDRATESNCTAHTIFTLGAHTETELRCWLAENDILGADATGAFAAILYGLKELLETSPHNPKNKPSINPTKHNPNNPRK